MDRPSGAVAARGDAPTFQQAVHAAVAGLARGEVVTYAEVAEQVGRPGAARAVGGVLARSEGLPWWRVVTSTGRLVPGHEAEHARRLRSEGVPVDHGRVRPPRHGESRL